MTFEQQHKDVTELDNYDTLKTYRSLSTTGNIVEAWDRDENGVWRDVTLREQAIQRAERELAAAKREVDKCSD